MTNFSTIWELVEDRWVIVRTYRTWYALDRERPGRYMIFPKGIDPNA